MKTLIFAVVAAVAALAAGGYAWQTRQALEETKQGLAAANADLDKAKASLKTLQAETVALKKEAAEQKIALEQAQADLQSARLFVEAERMAMARLREDLARAMTMARTPQAVRPGSGIPPELLVPRLAPQQPMQVRIAPNQGATAVGAPMPAMPAR